MLRQATLRVTNVSTDATRDDMHELFRKFGPIARVSVPQVRNTHTARRTGVAALTTVVGKRLRSF